MMPSQEMRAIKSLKHLISASNLAALKAFHSPILFGMKKHLLYLLPCWFILSCEPAQPNQAPTNEAPAIKEAEIVVPEAPATPKISEFEQMFRDSGLVNLEEFIPGIHIDLKYTTTDNFVSADVYGDLDKCFLRKEAAEKLKKAQDLLQAQRPGYSLLVFDGVRPFRVQQLMWDSLHIPNKRNYLAPPSEGSVHNYGCAVDLSIADSLGKEIDMGTPFDFFGELAQPKFEGQMLANGKLTQAQYDNRILLRKVMKQAGFFDIHTEWWHFNAFGSKAVKTMFSRIP
jgi:zinc D-Ala-D-Ala dipeptidase